MKKKYLLNHLKPGGRTFSVLVTLLVTAMTILPQSVWGQTDYGLTVGGVVVTSVNAESITGDNIQGSVSFDVQTSALTLEGATTLLVRIPLTLGHPRHFSPMWRPQPVH